MIKPLYSVRDLKAGYGIPFTEVNDDSAARGFQFAINRPDTLAYANSSDYELFKVALFDDETGIITPIEKEFICNAEVK